MNCLYCDQIFKADPTYPTRPAQYDLGSHAPRCERHWRYICGHCDQAAHFMSTAYCAQAKKFFCIQCAQSQDAVEEPFWGWAYYFRYQSPWSHAWEVGLDRLEFESKHPTQLASLEQRDISNESHLPRYPVQQDQWIADKQFTDDDVQANWNENATLWDANYDEHGDRNRRYFSDEPMLQLLGDVAGQRILDVGSGNGYLCRKLTKAGAIMTGVELSDTFMALAHGYEAQEPLGITYHHHSASQMDFLADVSFDKAVSNYVLMDIADYENAVKEVYRLLRPSGSFVAVISHPCFSSGPGWQQPAPDSPRREEREFLIDNYFHRGATFAQWGEFKPVLGFHRPLRDYWQTFTEAGFQVTGFEEPSLTELGHQELPAWTVNLAMRITHSCIFQLVKPKA